MNLREFTFVNRDAVAGVDMMQFDFKISNNAKRSFASITEN